MIKNVFTKKFRREERRVVWGESKALALKCSMCWSMWDCMMNWINLRSHMGQELVRDRCGMIPCGLWKTITKGRMCWTSWSVKVKLIICIHELESSNNSSNFSRYCEGSSSYSFFKKKKLNAVPTFTDYCRQTSLWQFFLRRFNAGKSLVLGDYKSACSHNTAETVKGILPCAGVYIHRGTCGMNVLS